MRIASLLASGTEIVCALGAGDRLVAISHECDYPPDVLGRPRVSRPRFDAAGLDSGAIDRALRDAMAAGQGAYALDVQMLRDARPDLLLAPAVCEVCAVPTTLAEQAAAALDGRPRVLSLDAHSMDDILGSIRDVGDALGVSDRAQALVARLEERIAEVRRTVRDAPPPSVLALEWLDPPFVPGHWMPEMVEAAGGTNLLAAARVPSRQVTWDELHGLDPDVLLVMPCGYDTSASRRDADRYADRIVRVASRAVERGRAWALDGSAYFNRSGPRMVDGVELLAALLHPDRTSHYDLAGRAVQWRRPATGRSAIRRSGGRTTDNGQRITDGGDGPVLYDPAVVQPMREELTRLGFEHLMTPEEVDAAMDRREGTTLVVVNSVCGCAAGMARPGVATALQRSAARPDHLVTVFAGMELEAVERQRAYFAPYPPSSPQIALFKDGSLVHMIERRQIEGRLPEEIADDLTVAFTRHCSPGV